MTAVHPRGTFDLIVLGGGSAGVAAAIRAEELDARVALVEGVTLGGTCVNVGCVPSKTLLRAAEAQYRRTHHGFAGIPDTNGTPAWPAIRADKDALVTMLRTTKYEEVLRQRPRITLLRGTGRLGSAEGATLSVHLGGDVIRAPALIVATGSAPWAPDLPGLAAVPALDSTSAMALDRLPRTLAVVGAGYVGVELGQMFARLGVRVTLIARHARVLPHEDEPVGEALTGYLRAEGIDVHTSAEVTLVQAAERGAGEPPAVRLRLREPGADRSVLADALLLATGRRPRTAGLGLESHGIRLGATGEIAVDQHLRAGSGRIYAAGDVIGRPMYVYVAAYAGALAAENALTGDRRRYDLTAVPAVTFTDPAVASVGMTEGMARERATPVRAARLPLTQLPRALAAHDTRGFIQLVAHAETRELVGAQILAAEAGEMIAEAGLAIRYGLTLDQITAAFHPYLTLGEGIRLAAQAFDREVATLSCCA